MSLAFAAIAALLPGFAWLFFYLKEDVHPEPMRVIVRTFIGGGVFALLALFLQLALKQFGLSFTGGAIPWLGGAEATAIIAIVLFALIEEIAKFWAAYTSIHDDPAFDEPIDAMIYLVVAALGFATVENLGAVAGTPGTYSDLAFVGMVAQTVVFRFVGATLLHTLTSAIVGYHWARDIRRLRAGGGGIAIGIIIATALHVGFNYLIITYGNIAYAVGFVAIIGLFVLNDFEKLKPSPTVTSP